MKTRTVPIEEAPASRCPARHIATALLFIAACDTSIDTLAVPSPSANRAKSAIAAVDSMHAGFHVRAFDLGENGDAPMRFLATVPSTVELLLYDRTVAELGLTTGELARSDDANALPVPDAREMFRAFLNNDGLSAWSVATERSPALAEFRTAIAGAGGPCAEWSLETITTTATGDTRFAVSVGEEITLVGTDFEYLRIDGAGWRVLGPVPPTIAYRSGRTDARGNVFFGTTGATIYRLKTIDPLAIELVGSSTPTAGSDSIQWMDGGEQDDGTLELYSVARNGSFERWTPLGPTLLYTLPFVNGGFSGGVAMIDRGRAIAINPDDFDATRYEDGHITRERILSTNLNQLTAIAHVRGLGTVIGAENGAFFLHDDAPGTNAWLELEHSSTAFRILAITPYEDGFVYAGELGAFGQYRRSQGYCPKLVPSADDMHYVVPHGDGFLLVPRFNDPTVRLVRATRMR